MADRQGEASSSSQRAASSPILSKIKETPFPPPKPQRRRHREEQIEAAYEIQRKAAIKGASIYTLLGLSSTFMAHHLFPKFRSQTLALKAFIVSGFTIFGFVVGADTVLLNHEGRQRSEEDLIRTVAKRELARQGRMASESEIERWKDQTRERLLREQDAAKASASAQATAQTQAPSNETR